MDGTYDTDVADARASYNVLNATQQALVANEADLADAEAGIATDEASLNSAISNASKIFIANDITVNAPVAVNQEVLINGNGKTVTAGVTQFAGASHNSVIVISENDVEITNLTVDSAATTPGTWQTPARFGMQVYNATGVVLNDITLKNGQAGLLVNAATADASVEGSEINTSDNNGFGGIEVYAAAGHTSTLKLLAFNQHNPSTLTPAIWSEGAGTTTVNPGDFSQKHNSGETYSYGGTSITVPANQTHWQRMYQ